jgi:hypothetical protein
MSLIFNIHIYIYLYIHLKLVYLTFYRCIYCYRGKNYNSTGTRQEYILHVELKYVWNVKLKPQAIRVKNKNILPDISVHGNWGIWGSWSVCSKICESGSQHRTRFCNDPETKHNGEHCSGRGYFVTSHDGYRRTDIKKQTMRQSCNVQNCPGK